MGESKTAFLWSMVLVRQNTLQFASLAANLGGGTPQWSAVMVP